MGAPRSIVIIGAGISGLTLALALAKFGVRVTVIDATPGSPNSARAQIAQRPQMPRRAGLRDAVAAASFAPRASIFTPSTLPPLQT